MGWGGPGDDEKARSKQIEGLVGKQTATGDEATRRSNKAFKFFTRSAKPAMMFWKDILQGDRNKIEELFAPQLSMISDANEQGRKSLLELNPRSGASATGMTEMSNRESQAISDLILKTPETAANNLASLSGMFGSNAASNLGIGLNAFQGAPSALLGLNQLAEEERKRKAALVGSIFEGIGSIAGGFAAGG